ncbi:hypothetical protein [Curtobacterium sp. VKM Ac-2884]|uniref:hypothetical protein n=1 Tax=Curtobacterium sp. VKM Ac-2884 TaxID=2783818 RepID=UPI00188DBB0E|nr:hypothetical protein [Curtobacterium sp. VKM Ac-2884]MBF4603761.1 hypothetical protein [Curtobacterium sp. VKM Ac-2884]
MSLLDNGPHAVTVQPRRPQQTPHGVELVDDGAPVVVRGLFHRGTGLWTSRSWTGDVNALVTDTDGEQWGLAAAPRQYDSSPATAHWEVSLVSTRPAGTG